MKTIQNILLIVIYVLTLASFAMDLIPNWKLVVTFKWIDYIFYHDPYYFRAQVLLFVPFMVFSLVCEIVILVYTVDYVRIAENINWTMSLNTAIYSILCVIEVIFPLVLTILELFRGCGKKPPSKDGILEDLLANKATETLFIDFCQKEFSLENVLCYKDVQEFKKTKHDPLGIYYKYLNGGASVMEVNVQRKYCVEIFQKLKSGEVTDNIFDDIEKELRTNLYDNYGRFKNSTKYVKYLKSIQTTTEMIEGKSFRGFSLKK
jgi:hypothetical protein